MKIEVVQFTSKECIASHTHIKGLGLKFDGKPQPLAVRESIMENKEVYDGEVTGLSPGETESNLGYYGKSISHVIIGLKIVKGSKKLKLDPTIYDALIKENVVAGGDVIYIEQTVEQLRGLEGVMPLLLNLM